ncbi:MAG TPA: SUF system NifU family Fe-S cluster assembly protein [archaeon]|nr:SUF system NifU family Fe-S cluster assembly protein [archaeon]
MSDAIYKDKIVDHYKNPRNFGSLKNASSSVKENNPSCGDEIEIQMIIEDNKIKDIKFQGIGCVISVASTSMLTSFIKGKNLEDVQKLTKDDVIGLLGIHLSPVRLKCALLPLNIIRSCLNDLKSSKKA